MKELYEKLIADQITMVDKNGFETIIKLKDAISLLPGDIIEVGCWRGGMSIFLSKIFSNKKIWVCDSFQGFQPADKAKYFYETERHTPDFVSGYSGPLQVSLDQVKNNFKAYELENDPRITFVPGFVKDTLSNLDIHEISLLRVDVDAYSATLETLDALYDKVVPGGVIIFDDSCLRETLDAIKFFFQTRELESKLTHLVLGPNLDINMTHTGDDSGLPCGCYFTKK